MLAMTLPTAGPWASSIAMPQTQNTAPVLEFRCLYTLDLRRKQKRWQDGRLKFHTFNKRIMVYDDRSNFVGDSHWREDHAFAEGEEVELERCGILVEVSEFVGTREQDLTPLLNRVVKDRQEKSHVRAVASSLLRPPGLDIRTQTIGLPHAEATDLRSAKRRKPNNSPSSKNGYAQDLTGAILALSGTPSTAGPLRYDPLWLRTMKQPIEGIDMSDGSGIHRMPQERPVPISKSQTKMSGSQAKRMSKKLSPACVNSGYARNITGAALVLASKTLRSRGLPPASGIVRKAVTRLDENGPAAITIEEDEFVDIDVYDKENLRVEKALGSSSQVTDLAKTRQEKPLPDSLSHQPQFEGDRHERPFNPLRIRTRPKRKLLLSATPPSRPLSLTGPSVETGNGAIFSPKSPKYDRESLLSLATVPQHAPVTEIVSFDIKGHCSSSPVNAGMDHHGIDVLLTRKVSGQTSMAEGQYGNVQARTEYRNSIRSAEESKELTGLEGQDRALLSHILGPQLEIKQKVTRSPRQPLILRGNTDTEIDRDRTCPPKNSRPPPPRLMKSSSDGAQTSELRGLTITTTKRDITTLNPTYQADRDLVMKQDVIPFKQLSKLTGPRAERTKVAGRDNEECEHDENVMLPMIVSTTVAVPVSKAKIARQHAVGNRNQGPWSREAFDLFDWRPGTSTTEDSLAVG